MGAKAYLMLHLTTGLADGELAILSDDNPSVRSRRERWVRLGENTGRDYPDAFVGLVRRLRRNKHWAWAVDDLEASRRPRVKLVRMR
jgi:hypothetical protein